MKLLKLVKKRLSNGLMVYYALVDETVTFDVALHLNTGSRDENEKNNGVSHFLEHMMFRGSKKFPDSISLGRALESFGSESNALTGVENTVYWLRGSNKKFDEGLKVFAEFFLYPNFAELELERSVILQELASDYNEESLNIDTETLSMGAMFGKDPIGMPIIGTEKTVSKIGVKELRDHRAKFYLPGEAVLAICSSLPPQKVFGAAEKCLGQKWAHAKRKTAVHKRIDEKKFLDPKAKKEDVLVLQENSDNQFSAKILFPAHGGLNKNVVAQNFLQRLLDDGMTARLPALLRERHGLVYDVSCDATNYIDVGTFSVEFSVSLENFDKVLQKLSSEFHELMTRLPTKAEMEHMRFRYLFELESMRETPQRILNREASNAFLSSSMTLEEECEAVKALTAVEVREKARQLFRAQRRAFVLVGPKAAAKKVKIEKFFKSLV